MSQAIANGLTIEYDDLGQGEPALLLMSDWCMNRTSYNQIPKKCAENRRVIVLDWRGHGESDSPVNDFSSDDFLEDALAVIDASGVQQIIPVAHSHAGWVAIKLRRKLGERIPKLVHIDWPIFPAPSSYINAIKAIATPDKWQETREHIFQIWLEGIDNPELINFVRKEMGSYSAEMWMRAGRDILACYVERGYGYPLAALNNLEPHIPVLHIYSQPKDTEYLNAQESFASANSWFGVHKLEEAHSHFPMFEVPDTIATTIEKFVA